ncbi:MAG TPA: Fic/DOC family N-terminal domain-containing protein [Pyrinomonadaceae bacterium]|nr:Fic/DOC family N-terminal domain-containing protein [Pyrinomonadaceae bacterium]
MYSGPGSTGGVEGSGELIPNPSILINTLPLLEAQASSEIENIVTTTDRLFQFRELHAQADAAHSHELMNLIFELPYCRIQNVTERKIAVRQTASGYLKELVRVGVLEEKVVGREKLFIHPKLMRLLTQERNTFEPYS